MEQWKQRIAELNKLRLQRALDEMPESFRQVHTALPLLLHYNCVNLPGYLQDAVVPCGVANYEPEDSGFLLLNLIEPSQRFIHQQLNFTPDIMGVYSMGSTASIGQTPQSDLDIWVCVSHNLSTELRQKLHDKCLLIEIWAKQQGVDLSLFIVDERLFSERELQYLDVENCGSAQHILLLEEFYRTKTILAGKWILWDIIPVEHSTDVQRYTAFIQQQVNAGELQLDEWVDFGPLETLSAGEYFGAILWQLYKSIDSPYKSFLKALLLEMYAEAYPNAQLLALEAKRTLHESPSDYLYLDAYIIVLNKVSDYLISIQDRERLELLRRCFYLKVREKLSIPKAHFNWRRAVLESAVKEWGWSTEQISGLDNRLSWKIEQVRQENAELLEVMMAIYRRLIQFGRRHNLHALISPQDLNLLTRKLYAAFEVLPGKVTLFTQRHYIDLSETTLTFIHVQVERVNRVGWYLYNRAPKLGEITGRQYLEHTNYLSKSVGWCYFNGLINDTTQFYIKSYSACNVQKLKRFVKDITDYFPRSFPVITKKELYSPCEIRQLAIYINLEVDPTLEIQPSLQELQEPLSVDVLSYGEEQLNLIGSIDFIYRNSWNEMRTAHFEGESCLLDALRMILDKMHKGAQVPELALFCYSHTLRKAIAGRMKRIVMECLQLRLSTASHNVSRFKPLHIAGQTWGLFFEHLGVSAYQFEKMLDLYKAISNNKLKGSALQEADDKPRATLPNEIYAFASRGIIQFFFEKSTQSFNVYILDERNQVEIYLNCDGTIERMLRDVHRFYSLSHDSSSANSNGREFNLPQFYQLLENNGQTYVVPYFNPN